MFTLKYAFRNIISRKSSLVIIVFISFSIALLVMANAVFDGTGNGIEKTFSSSFTGDVVIQPLTDFPMSLFGDETPVTGELSELPRINPYTIVSDYILNQPEIKYISPQLTGQGVLKIDDMKKSVVLFGVNPSNYLKIMSAINILEGNVENFNDKSIMISDIVRQDIEKSIGKKIQIGDEVQFISSNGSSYTLRKATLCAIYKYEVQNDLQKNIVIVSPEVVRSLLGIESLSSSQVIIDKNQSTMIDDFENIESLFGEENIFDSSEDASLSLESSADVSFENSSEQQIENSVTQDNEDTTWNYIICKLQDEENPNKFVKKANEFFKQNEYNVVAVSWRQAAGMSAQYIYWMRLIFNIGLILLIGTGFIVVNNTLIIAAIDRTKETGALRAIGADRKFIAIEYLFETLLLTITAGILGCVLGVIGNHLIVSANITFSNSYLIQLFGGTQLNPIVTISNIIKGMSLSFVLAIIGWCYPVHIALGTSPVVAMEHI